MFESLRNVGRWLRVPLDYRHAKARLERFHSGPARLDAAVDLALHFGGRGIYKLRTTQIPGEILCLAERFRGLGPRTIVEIGTAWGGTLFLWSQIAADRVVSCDLVQKKFLRDLAPHFPPPGGCRVTLLQGDSHEDEFRERLWSEVGPKGADALFVDGDHTQEGVEKDYRDYAGLVRPGGFIAFHDIAERQPVPTNQVGLFWRRLKGQGETEEVVGDPDQCGYGIGILRMPETGNPPRPEPAGKPT